MHGRQAQPLHFGVVGQLQAHGEVIGIVGVHGVKVGGVGLVFLLAGRNIGQEVLRLADVADGVAPLEKDQIGVVRRRLGQSQSLVDGNAFFLPEEQAPEQCMKSFLGEALEVEIVFCPLPIGLVPPGQALFQLAPGGGLGQLCGAAAVRLVFLEGDAFIAGNLKEAESVHKLRKLLMGRFGPGGRGIVEPGLDALGKIPVGAVPQHEIIAEIVDAPGLVDPHAVPEDLIIEIVHGADDHHAPFVELDEGAAVAGGVSHFRKQILQGFFPGKEGCMFHSGLLFLCAVSSCGWKHRVRRR